MTIMKLASYLGPQFVCWLIAAFLHELLLRKDPDVQTVVGKITFGVVILFGICGLAVTLLVSFAWMPLVIHRLEGKDEASYSAGYIAGYDDAKNHRTYNSQMPPDHKRPKR